MCGLGRDSCGCVPPHLAKQDIGHSKVSHCKDKEHGFYGVVVMQHPLCLLALQEVFSSILILGGFFCPEFTI